MCVCVHICDDAGFAGPNWYVGTPSSGAPDSIHRISGWAAKVPCPAVVPCSGRPPSLWGLCLGLGKPWRAKAGTINHAVESKPNNKTYHIPTIWWWLIVYSFYFWGWFIVGFTTLWDWCCQAIAFTLSLHDIFIILLLVLLTTWDMDNYWLCHASLRMLELKFVFMLIPTRFKLWPMISIPRLHLLANSAQRQDINFDEKPSASGEPGGSTNMLGHIILSRCSSACKRGKLGPGFLASCDRRSRRRI